jgi:ABC-2 type transport system permease protein
MLTGELFPLDLVPEPYRTWVISLPFANAVYIPVGYLTGRFGIEVVVNGVISILVSLAVLAVFSRFLWINGRRRYSGTGA